MRGTKPRWNTSDFHFSK